MAGILFLSQVPFLRALKVDGLMPATSLFTDIAGNTFFPPLI